MLSYWILRDESGAPAGLVRVENGRAVLRLHVPVEGTFTIFSETGAVPIEPDTETALKDPVAVLGMNGDRVTCFAAAPSAAPKAQYRMRLSQIRTKPQPPLMPDPSDAPEADDMPRKNTIEAEPKPSEEGDSEEIYQNSTIEAVTVRAASVTETARETEAFSLLLRRADAFFERYAGKKPPDVDNLVQKEDNLTESGIDLFPHAFPGARWRYVEGTDVLGHYEGVYRQPNGLNLHVLAVRGRAAPCPPRTLAGFTRFLRAQDGTGYWLKITPLP